MQKSATALFFLISSGILFSYVAGSEPLFGLLDPNCFVTIAECPNEKVNFWLYTNETRDRPLLLDPFDLYADDFYPPRPVKILIHGYTGHRDFAPNLHLRPVLLQNEDVYVISVDFEPLVRNPCYFTGVASLPVAAKCLAQLINNLVNEGIVYNEDIHLIGYSLGAHVAGQTANFVHHKLKRITGLDPAKPMFITVAADSKLDASDAEFVDIIHTDVMGRGLLRAMGHADFYPNIGPYQPGCRSTEFPGSCNHNRAPEFYAESIVSRAGFWSYSCPTWLHKIFGLCFSRGNQALMGYFVDENSRGSFFLETGDQTPFALGPISVQRFQNRYALKYNNVEVINDVSFEPELRETYGEISDNELQSVDKLHSYYKNFC